MQKTRVVCIAEDRLSEIIPIKLLLLSLINFCPDIKIILFFSPATNGFKSWLMSLKQDIQLRTFPIAGAYGWCQNYKLNLLKHKESILENYCSC